MATDRYKHRIITFSIGSSKGRNRTRREMPGRAAKNV